MNDQLGINELLHPHSVDEFFHEVFEKRPLLVQRQCPDYYGNLLGISDLDDLLKNPVIQSKYIRMHQQGKEIAMSHWSRNGLVNVDHICKLFNQGATFIINGGHRFFPQLDHFCQTVEQQLYYHVQANIYVTPEQSSGFDTHYDDHDVFIMQLAGSKNWRIYKSVIDLPTKSQKHQWGKFDPGTPLLEFDLEQGDMFYIPRGFMHDASASDQLSIHITFGLHPNYLYDLVDEFARSSQQQFLFRKALPPNIYTTKTRDTFGGHFKKLLHDLVDDADIGSLLNTLKNRFVRSRRPVVANRFSTLLSLSKIDQHTQLMVRSNTIHQLDKDNDANTLSLKFSTNSLIFPLFLYPTLSRMLQPQMFTVKELPGLLDETEKTELVKELTCLGLLEVQTH